MVISFTLQDLLLFLGCVLLLGVGIVLIIVLLRLKKILTTVSGILDANRQNLEDTLQSLPVITKNAEVITEDFKVTSAAVSQSAPEILSDVEDITGAANEGVQAIVELGTDVGDTVKSIKRGTTQATNVVQIVVEIAQLVAAHLKSD